MKNKTHVNKVKSSFPNETRPALPNQETPDLHPELMRMIKNAPSRPELSMVVVDVMIVGFHVSCSQPSAKDALALIEEVLRGGDWPMHSAPTHVCFDSGELGLTRSDAVPKPLPNRDRRNDKARKADDQIHPTT